MRIAPSWWAALLLALAAAIGPVQAQTSTNPAPVTPYLDPAAVLDFADFLWTQRDFGRAATEYQRYLFSGGGPREAHAQFQLGRSYQRLAEPTLALGAFAAAARQAPRPSLRDSAQVARAGTLLLTGPAVPFLDAAATLQQRVENAELHARLQRLEALAFMDLRQWDAAAAVLARPDDPGGTLDPALQDLVVRGQQLPRKSPLLAGVLSAVVPGSGKVYGGYALDGLYSLLLVGSNAWLSYEGFRDRGIDSFKGWFFGAVGTVLYTGNIYGSVVSVRLQNRAVQEALHEDIHAQIQILARF